MSRAAIALGILVLAPLSAYGQATDVRALSGDGTLFVTFTPSPAGVAHDIYLAAEPGVTSANFITLERGRAIRDVASPLTIRGLDNNRDYYLALVERDGAGGAASAQEISATPRGAWGLVSSEASFVSVDADPLVAGLALAAGNAAGGCPGSPTPPGCDAFRSTDGGRTWAVATADIPDLSPTAVAVRGGLGLVASNNPAAIGARIFHATDAAGGGFQLRASGNAAVSVDKVFAFDPSNPTTIYGGNFDFGRGISSQVVKSIDGAMQWPHVPEALTPNVLNARAIAVDPANPLVIWLGGPGAPRLARSIDGGASWAEVVITVIGAVEDIVFDPLTPTKVWLADSQQVYGSQNGGAVFTPRFDGFAPGTLLRALARDGEAGVLYVGSSTGVYESRDDGRTFAPIGASLSAPVTDVAFSSDPPALLAATPSGLFRLDMAPPGAETPMPDAGPGDGDGGDGGCGCSAGSSPSPVGTVAWLVAICALFVGRGRGARVAQPSPRRSRE